MRARRYGPPPDFRDRERSSTISHEVFRQCVAVDHVLRQMLVSRFHKACEVTAVALPPVGEACPAAAPIELLAAQGKCIEVLNVGVHNGATTTATSKHAKIKDNALEVQLRQLAAETIIGPKY